MGKNSSNYHRSWQNREGFGKDGYDEYEDYDGFGPWYGNGHRSTNSEIDIHTAVEPLIRHIKIYDKVRQKLEKKGGAIEDFATIVTILSKEIFLEGDNGQIKVALKDPGAVRYALFDIDYWHSYRIRLQVRELRSGLPGYYICRTIDIHYASYSLIVEDLYCSPGYPMPDNRFVRLMKGGKEESFLRVSPFRAEIKKRIQDIKDQNRSIERETDRILYNLGRYVLGPAWHEDQFPGMQAASHFELRRFSQVIELLYLVLSGELCELRGQIDTDMLDIFRTIIRQPSIFDFLKKLIDLNGAELNDLPKEALAHYVSLLNAFSQFLVIEIPWGRRKTKMPLNKLLLGNFSRLHLVVKALNQSKNALKAKKRLEDKATKIISMMTQKKQKAQVC